MIKNIQKIKVKINNKFDMNGEDPETVVERLAKYIEDIKNGIEPIKNQGKDEKIMGFKVYNEEQE